MDTSSEPREDKMILSLQKRLLQLVGFPVPILKSFLDRVLDPKGLFTWVRLIGLARFPISRLTSISFVNDFRCAHISGRAGWRSLPPEISVFPNRISVSGLDILPFEHASSVTGMKAGRILRMNSAWSCFACCIFLIISISFDNSDTAIRVAKAITGAKVTTLYFDMFVLFLEFRAPTSPRPFLT